MDDLLFLAIFVGVIVFIVFLMFARKGKSLLLGGSIIKTYDDEVQAIRRIGNSKIRVHVLEKSLRDRKVGMEVRSTAAGSFHIMPITLTAKEAKKLSELLNIACDYQGREP